MQESRQINLLTFSNETFGLKLKYSRTLRDLNIKKTV